MGVESLESVMFAMAADIVRQRAGSFSDKLQEIAKRTNGRVMFNVRVDRDRHVQRLAAIGYDGVRGVGIVGLANDGSKISAVFTEEDLSRFTQPLVDFQQLPMREQAQIDVRSNAFLLLAAMRNIRRKAKKQATSQGLANA